MTSQKVPTELKSITSVTSIQLIVMFLLLGIAAGVFASVLLGVENKLRVGMGFWLACLITGIALFAGLALGYLKFMHKARGRSIYLKNYRLKTTRPLFTSKR